MSLKSIDNPQHISILFPTRKRPHYLKNLFDSLEDTTADKTLIDVWLYIDEDDTLTKDFIDNCLENHQYSFDIKYVYALPSIAFGEMYNQLLKKCRKNPGIYMFCADKILFITKGWDKIVRETFNSYPDKILFANAIDPHMAGSPYGAYGLFLSAEWINLLGKAYTEYFSFWYDDSWLIQVALMIQRRVNFNNVELDLQGGKGVTIRMRNLVFWDRFFANTIDERIEEARILRDAIYPHDSLEYRHSEAEGYKQTQKFIADLQVRSTEELIATEQFCGDPEALKSPPTADYLANELRAAQHLQRKAKSLISQRKTSEAIKILDNIFYASQETKDALKKTVLFFFPHNPYPPRTGAHRHGCLEVISALKDLGCEVILFSSTLFTDNPWQTSSIQDLQNKFGIKVIVYEGTAADQEYILHQRSVGIPGIMNWNFFTPPGLRESFLAVFREVAADIIFINYSLWGKLAVGNEFKSAIRVIETHDLLTLTIKMADTLNCYLNTDFFDPNHIDPKVIDEQFFSKLNLKPDPEEYRICDQYDYTTSVSGKESKLIQENTSQTQVVYTPVTLQAPKLDNTYTDAPLFVISLNPFNIQGYLYFASRILPEVLQQIPEFKLQVIGNLCDKLVAVPGIELLGFVEDLKPFYTASPFAICPLIGGTGQQVKIVEAMAHGVPVIALRNVADTSPIQHGINGFIANNAAEFVEFTIRLWQDRDLCRQMGAAARQTITDNFPQNLLVDKLKQITNKSVRVNTKKDTPTIVVDGAFFQRYKTGIARVWKSLLEEWAANGFGKHIVVLDRVGTAPKIPGIWYRQIPAYDYNNTDADRQMLQSVCDQEGAELFISTYYTTPLTTPSVFMAYDMIPEVMGADINNPMWREKHYGIQHASSYLSISENTAQDLIKFFPEISPDSVTVAYCGVHNTFSPASLENVNNFKIKYGISKPYFILVGIGGYKNTELFLKAFSQLPSKQGFEIIFTGTTSGLENDWRSYTSGTIVHILELTDEELSVAYSGAICLVYPSKYEGFGLPILEAIACGCPVITCPNASIPEVAGKAALYVNDQDINGLINALCEVQKPEVRKVLITEGIEQAKKFSWTQMAQIVSEALIDATLLSLKLKEINLIIFPDWSAPEESLGIELQTVMRMIATHPDSNQITLLINTQGVSEEDANLILSSVAMNLLMEEDLDINEGVEISLVKNLEEIQWKALLPRLKARIVLEHENKQAIAPVISELPLWQP